ncbi:MAG: glycosyltransferase family 2 protein [Anaerolineaceae bacterium]|nr:glycosyltransferase family 2 protein [Anaerolineaceae bacterium]
MKQRYSLIAVVLTFNEARHIRECLACLGFADQVLVLDSFSTDGTPELAADAGARVEQRRFKDYADQRNHALDLLRDETCHVLFVDADERVSPELASEIQGALSARPDLPGWRIPRHNLIFGRLTLHAGWYPDYQTRLLKTGCARYEPDRPVHELVQLDGKPGTLKQPLLHFNYDSLQQFLDKQRDYSERAAGMRHARKEQASPRDLLSLPLHHFRWRYVTMQGYRDGWHGLRLCALMAWYEFRTIRRLRSLSRQGVIGTSKP